MTAIWFIVVQWISSAFGGYLTGRTRTKWVGVHSHEVTFRDTAHGLATWAVATLATSAIVALGTAAVIGGGAKVAASAAAGVGQAGAAALSNTGANTGANAGAKAGEIGGYEVDALFRSTSATAGATPETRSEVLQILAKGVRDGDVPADDRKYLADLIAAKTGIPQPEAEQRVNSAIEQVKAASVKARELADAARKTAAAAAICTALSMLIGAFIAMVAAALGGRERDLHV